jgi:hypothetical protein
MFAGLSISSQQADNVKFTEPTSLMTPQVNMSSSLDLLDSSNAIEYNGISTILPPPPPPLPTQSIAPTSAPITNNNYTLPTNITATATTGKYDLSFLSTPSTNHNYPVTGYTSGQLGQPMGFPMTSQGYPSYPVPGMYSMSVPPRGIHPLQQYGYISGMTGHGVSATIHILLSDLRFFY